MKRTDRIADKILPNGVVVPASLQVNEMTLAEHQNFLAWCQGHRKLSYEEAVRIHGQAAADEYFGRR